MIYKGSCHCGEIVFEVEGELTGAIDCNCSICSQKGGLLWVVPKDSLRLLSPEASLGTYTFNQHVIRHRFCKHCGIHTFAEGMSRSGKVKIVVNLRCIRGIDPASLPVRHFDGRSL